MVYNFGTKQEFEKRYVGVIVRTKTGRRNSQYEVSFLRKQKSVSLDDEQRYYFTYPERILDKWLLDENQILQTVQLERLVRGKHYFNNVNFDEIETNA